MGFISSYTTRISSGMTKKELFVALGFGGEKEIL
jgi:hypothetical protein